VVAASKQVVDVFVDCDWGKKNVELAGRFKVNGYPTVLMTDSYGRLIATLQGRDAHSVIKLIEDNAKKGGGAPLASWEKASAAAKKAKLPVLYLFTTTDKDSEELEEALFDPALYAALDGFVVARASAKESADAKRFGVAAGDPPAILVLDPKSDKPEAAPLKKITGKKTAAELAKELESVAKPGAK